MSRARMRALVPVLGLSIVAAACGGDGGTKPGTDPQDARPENAKRGGTLKVKGAGDVDHLDTASGYYTATYSVLRAVSRQLVSYPTSADEKKRDLPVADAAED